MKIWDLSNSFNDTFLYIKFDITLLYIIEKGTCFRAALIKQHEIVFGKRRSFGYAVSPFDRLPSKDAGSIPTRS